MSTQLINVPEDLHLRRQVRGDLFAERGVVKGLSRDGVEGGTSATACFVPREARGCRSDSSM